MKTKQEGIKAVFTAENEPRNGWQYNNKELVDQYVVTDKKTEKVVVDCRVYMGKSRNASTVFASIWINGINSQADLYVSGSGKAGGYGYCKASAAVESAIHSAGFELYGSPYNRKPENRTAWKNRTYIGGCGTTAIKDALLAIAYTAGCRDGILTY